MSGLKEREMRVLAAAIWETRAVLETEISPSIRRHHM